MKFKYVGPHDAVELAGYGEVKHGEVIDVTTTRTARSLVKQTDWQRVPPEKKKD